MPINLSDPTYTRLRVPVPGHEADNETFKINQGVVSSASLQ